MTDRIYSHFVKVPHFVIPALDPLREPDVRWGQRSCLFLVLARQSAVIEVDLDPLVAGDVLSVDGLELYRALLSDPRAHPEAPSERQRRAEGHVLRHALGVGDVSRVVQVKPLGVQTACANRVWPCINNRK